MLSFGLYLGDMHSSLVVSFDPLLWILQLMLPEEIYIKINSQKNPIDSILVS